MLLLSGVGEQGSYLADVLPGMVIAGLGLGIVLVAVAVSVLTGARDEESGNALRAQHHRPRDRRLTRDRHPGHASPPAPSAPAPPPSGIGDAYLAAAVIAAVASAAALVILPSAKTFLPKLALTPHVAVH